jgi:hypothetical protein
VVFGDTDDTIAKLGGTATRVLSVNDPAMDDYLVAPGRGAGPNRRDFTAAAILITSSLKARKSLDD